GWQLAMFSAGDAAFPYAPVGLIGWMVSNLAGALGGVISLANYIVVGFFQIVSLIILARMALAMDMSNPGFSAAWAPSAAVLLAPIIQPWYILWLMALFAISHRVSWGSEKLMIHVSSVILIAVFVDQLSIEQWHSAWIMKSLAGVLALGLFIGLFT